MSSVQGDVSRRGHLRLREVPRAARAGLRLRADHADARARSSAGRRTSGATASCCRSPASRRPASTPASRRSCAATRLAERLGVERALHQGRLGQPSDAVLQGPRRVGRGDARRGARASRCWPARRPATSPTACRRTPRASGMECCVFIPDNLEAGKVLGSAIFGPTILAIAGNYDDVNRLCTQVADRYGWGFVNINLRSYYAEGAKTMGFEIVEQLGWRYPAAPRVAGRGRHAAAAHRARASRAAADRARRGRAAAHPRGAGGRLRAGRERARERRSTIPSRCGPNTIAKSIAIGNPADGYQVLQTVRDDRRHGRGGDRRRRSSTRSGCWPRPKGIFTEPAGGTTLAGDDRSHASAASSGRTSRSSSASPATATRRRRS